MHYGIVSVENHGKSVHSYAVTFAVVNVHHLIREYGFYLHSELQSPVSTNDKCVDLLSDSLIFSAAYHKLHLVCFYFACTGPVCHDTNQCSHNPCKIGERCVVTSTYFKCECIEPNKCDLSKYAL